MKPMISDCVWWKSAGKVEWDEVQDVVQGTVSREKAAGNPMFVDEINKFYEKVRALQN